MSAHLTLVVSHDEARAAYRRNGDMIPENLIERDDGSPFAIVLILACSLVGWGLVGGVLIAAVRMTAL